MSGGNAWKSRNHSGRAKVAVGGRILRFAAGAAVACTIAALGASPAVAASGHEHADPAGDTQGPLDLAGASWVQEAREITLTIRTKDPVSKGNLPGDKRGTLCTTLAWGTPILPQRRFCIVSVGGKPVVNDDTLEPKTEKILTRHQRKIVTQSGTRFAIRFDPVAIGLPVGLLHFTVHSTWHKGSPCDTTDCSDQLPDHGSFSGRVYRAVAAGCAPSSGQVTNGSRTGKQVAITFDDGPSTFTPAYLKILKEEHAVATFFQIGQEIGAYGAIDKSILAAGSAIGDHTWDHADVSRGGAFATSELSRTVTAIKGAAGGYQPCLFRPPYGATSGALVAAGSSLGLKSVLWDVDTNDWQLPGTAAIVSRAVGGARPGSIILMHDGGGPRGQTEAAVRPVIQGLRAKGYTLVTVPELLGLKTRWQLRKT